jgi:hypothetical protein
MAAPKNPSTTAATAARRASGDATAVARLRAAGYTVTPPDRDVEVHATHDPEPDGVRNYSGGQTCRQCLVFVVLEGFRPKVTNAGVSPCPSRKGTR